MQPMTTPVKPWLHSTLDGLPAHQIHKPKNLAKPVIKVVFACFPFSPITKCYIPYVRWRIGIDQWEQIFFLVTMNWPVLNKEDRRATVNYRSSIAYVTTLSSSSVAQRGPISVADASQKFGASATVDCFGKHNQPETPNHRRVVIISVTIPISGHESPNRGSNNKSMPPSEGAP